MFNRSAIAKEAHRVARIYARQVGYRKALSWGFKQAWRTAGAIREIEVRDAALTVAERFRRDQILIIQCSTDGAFSCVHRMRLTELRAA